ncbi:MAG: hypothetical protein ACI4LX_05230 [Treponema sp.]
MTDFVFNSASIPLTDKTLAQSTTDDVFLALTNYIGDNAKPKLFFASELDDIFLAENFSFQNYSDDLITRNRELADFISEFGEYFSTFKTSTVFQQKTVKVGDDTRFSDDDSLKYACLNNNILVSVSEEHIWQRNRIKFCLIDNVKIEYELYNLFSSDFSYLPIELPPFSLSDKTRFRKTNFFHEKQAIYQDLQTGYYWYNDYFHKDNKAHFEVFDKTGNHIAEASMSGTIDYSKADSNKHIQVN